MSIWKNVVSYSRSQTIQPKNIYRLLGHSVSRHPSSDTRVQLVRSLVVSFVALAFDFGLLVIFTQALGIFYIFSATMSFLVGVVVNYYLSIWWVFPDHKLSSRKAEFIIFVIITGLGLALNLFIIASLVQVFGLDYRIAKSISTIVVFFWNFVARKRILY